MNSTVSMNFKKLVVLGIGLEIIIVLISYLISSDLSETFMYAARFSGRLSLIWFLAAIWQFTRSALSSEEVLMKTRSVTAVFAVLHYIHLFLLMMNVKLNAVSLIPYKLAGGMLAYLMILLYAVLFERIKRNKTVHTIYFLFVGFVMAMTYVARMKGDFEGAPPELIHKIGLGAVLSGMAYWIYKILLKKPSNLRFK